MLGKKKFQPELMYNLTLDDVHYRKMISTGN